MNIYVGNLSYSVTEQSLETLFGQYGTVVSVKVIKDKFTGSSKGFAFVEMGSEEEAQQAIEQLDGKDFEGRRLKVNKANPQERRPQNGDRRPPMRGPRRF